MRLYLVKSAPPYFVGTQAEAKRDARLVKADWEQVEVPTDKEGLIGFLNTMGGPASLQVEPNVSVVDVDVLPPSAQDEQDEVLESSTTFSDAGAAQREAERSRLKGVSLEVDAITERIGELDGWPLGSVAQAVTSRMAELAKSHNLLA